MVVVKDVVGDEGQPEPLLSDRELVLYGGGVVLVIIILMLVFYYQQTRRKDRE